MVLVGVARGRVLGDDEVGVLELGRVRGFWYWECLLRNEVLMSLGLLLIDLNKLLIYMKELQQKPLIMLLGHQHLLQKLLQLQPNLSQRKPTKHNFLFKRKPPTKQIQLLNLLQII